MTDRPRPYRLTLTADDVSAIEFAAGRYAWATQLFGLTAGENRLTESEAWDIKSACEDDGEGGHSMFPLLDPRSELAEKLRTFLERIV